MPTKPTALQNDLFKFGGETLHQKGGVGGHQLDLYDLGRGPQALTRQPYCQIDFSSPTRPVPETEESIARSYDSALSSKQPIQHSAGRRFADRRARTSTETPELHREGSRTSRREGRYGSIYTLVFDILW